MPLLCLDHWSVSIDCHRLDCPDELRCVQASHQISGQRLGLAFGQGNLSRTLFHGIDPRLLLFHWVFTSSVSSPRSMVKCMQRKSIQSVIELRTHRIQPVSLAISSRRSPWQHFYSSATFSYFPCSWHSLLRPSCVSVGNLLRLDSWPISLF